MPNDWSTEQAECMEAFHVVLERFAMGMASGEVVMFSQKILGAIGLTKSKGCFEGRDRGSGTVRGIHQRSKAPNTCIR